MILLVTANIQLFMFRSKFWSIFLFFVPLQAKKVTMMNHDNMEERFPVVDATGKVLGCATRGECHSGSHLLHPVVHLHVFNSKGGIPSEKTGVEGYTTREVGYCRGRSCRLWGDSRGGTDA